MTHPNNIPQTIARLKELLPSISETLAYFVDEFPKNDKANADHNEDVWEKPISPYAGGLTPNELLEIHDFIAAAPQAVATAVALDELVGEMMETIKFVFDAHHNADIDYPKSKAGLKLKSVLAACEALGYGGQNDKD